MVAPDDGVSDSGNVHSGSDGQLAEGSVVVKSGQTAEVLLGDLWAVRLKEKTVGVGGVGDHNDVTVWLGDLIQSITLTLEDLAVDAEEFLALQAGFSGKTTNENTNIDVLEDDLGVTAGGNGVQKGIGTVFDLEDDSLEDVFALGDIQETQVNLGGGAKDLTGEEEGNESVTDLTGGTCDSYCEN